MGGRILPSVRFIMTMSGSFWLADLEREALDMPRMRTLINETGIFAGNETA